jgi:YHS domain-containing protein
MEALVYFFPAWCALNLLMTLFSCGAYVGHGYRHQESRDRGDSSIVGRSLFWIPSEKDVDPVCGITVEMGEPELTIHEGRVYYFCSQSCRDRFEADPTSYVKHIGQIPRKLEHQHGF